MTAIDEVFELFEQRGGEAYFGESVSILEHSLQAAWLAEQAAAECGCTLKRSDICVASSQPIWRISRIPLSRALSCKAAR
jgi:hypothetical protein